MTAFGDAITAALATVRQTAGVAITYRRGDDEVTITDAVPTQARVRLTDPTTQLLVESGVMDFLVPAASLATLTPAEPAEGDEIDLVGPDGVTRTYQVLSPGGDEPPWRWSDDGSERTTARVHVKLIAEVSP